VENSRRRPDRNHRTSEARARRRAAPNVILTSSLSNPTPGLANNYRRSSAPLLLGLALHGRRLGVLELQHFSFVLGPGHQQVIGPPNGTYRGWSRPRVSKRLALHFRPLPRSHYQGWFGQRQFVQLAFIALVAIVCLIAAISLALDTQRSESHPARSDRHACLHLPSDPRAPNWIHEIKRDGFRLTARIA
jgi:hypothetical protein